MGLQDLTSQAVQSHTRQWEGTTSLARKSLFFWECLECSWFKAGQDIDVLTRPKKNLKNQANHNVMTYQCQNEFFVSIHLIEKL